MYINKAILYGNLVRDPEMKSLPSGIQVTSFSLATNHVFKDKNGTKQEKTDYHNIVVFGRQAETVKQFLHKGDGAYVEGRMQTRSWEGADKQKKYRTEVIADRVQFGPKRGPSDGTYAGKDTQTAKQEPQADTIEYPEEDINPEDIPF